MQVAFHENDGYHENDEGNSDSYEQEQSAGLAKITETMKMTKQRESGRKGFRNIDWAGAETYERPPGTKPIHKKFVKSIFLCSPRCGYMRRMHPHPKLIPQAFLCIGTRVWRQPLHPYI